jgi:prolyl-tRNA synthetase
MPKRNPALDRIETKWKTYYEKLFLARVGMMLQMGQDAALMAAYDVCQIEQEQTPAYAVAYREAVNELTHVVLEDQKDDKQFWYAKNWRDERIKLIVGEDNFLPWEECYACSK